LIFLQLQYAVDNRLALIEYNAALHSIGFMIFLGFADDVVDLPWRYKLILPTVATLPLLVAYSGSTYIAVPWPLVDIIGSSINLGILYQVRPGKCSSAHASRKEETQGLSGQRLMFWCCCCCACSFIVSSLL
jgi:UDP-N-acetylglucosamine--dolichyl-phosphate N-acetylglucosaminephosphotransferase